MRPGPASPTSPHLGLRTRAHKLLLGVGLTLFAAPIVAGILACPATAHDATAQVESRDESSAASDREAPRAIGALVRVADLEQAVDFYSELFAFEVVPHDYGPELVVLRNGPVELILHKVERRTKIDYPKVSEAHLNLQVENLARSLEQLRERKVPLLREEPAQAAIGPHMPITDPSGNLLHVVELSYHEGPLAKPRVFNFGITLTDMEKARSFYCDALGFEVFSEDYYPPVIPLRKSGALPLVLHETAERRAQPADPSRAQVNLLLAVEDVSRAVRDLESRGVEFLEDEPRRTPVGILAAFRDPFGNVHQLIERPESP